MTDAPRIRRSQALSPFGVGAILDVLGESFVACDIRDWRGRADVLDAPRAARLLGVENLRLPPAAPERGDDGPGVPFHRFPQWLFCPVRDCRRMVRWSLAKERALGAQRKPRCEHCAQRAQLVPMRFVIVCGNGHLDDVDWAHWAHSGSGGARGCAARTELRFEAGAGMGGGLDALAVTCVECRSSRSLRGIAGPETLKHLGRRCRGRQPWLPSGQEEECDADAVIVQRGASNVHFTEVASILDIPPDADFDQYAMPVEQVRAHADYAALLRNPEHPLRDGLLANIAFETGSEVGFVIRVLEHELDEPVRAPGGADFSPEQIRRDEWHAFTVVRRREVDPRDRFVVSHADLGARSRGDASGAAADELVGLFDRLVLAQRLREVRVLRGFRRYDMRRMVPSDLSGSTRWLPAVEIYGEGIFLGLDEPAVRRWETNDEVVEAVARMAERRRRSLFSSFLPEVTPRFVLLHTIAHLLIRQLGMDSGYSASSIRERVYCAGADSESPMAGVLLYTGAGDSEGTLGGLVRGGDPDWFVPSVLSALRNAEWCSLDPVCRESSAQGPDGLCLAACHACALVGETSCEFNNLLLDRSLLVDPTLGFFNEVLVSDARNRLGREA